MDHLSCLNHKDTSILIFLSSPILALVTPLWTPTPRPPRPSTLPPSSAPSTRTGLPLFRRGSHEREIDTDALIEQLRLVGAFDGGFGFFLRRVFD